MLIMDKKSNDNKVFNMFLRKARKHTENIEIKANIDIFYELFRIKEESVYQDLFPSDWRIFKSHFSDILWNKYISAIDKDGIVHEWFDLF